MSDAAAATQDQEEQKPTNGGGNPGNGSPGTEVATGPPATRTPLALGARGLEPQTFDELWRFAKVIAQSDLAPKDYKGRPDNVVVAVQMGRELGLAAMQSLQNIAVINGRPSVWGDAMLALVQASGLLADFEESIEGTGDAMRAVCVSVRHGRSKPHRSEFSMEDAKTAGLKGKQGPWTQYPRRMLQMRARGFNLRDNFPDVLKGLAMAEEVIDITPAQPIQDQAATASLSERIAAAQERTQAAQGQPAAAAAPAAPAEPAVDLTERIMRVNALVDQVEELKPGRGMDSLREIVGDTDIDQLTAEQLDEATAHLEAVVSTLRKPNGKPAGKAAAQQPNQGSLV